MDTHVDIQTCNSWPVVLQLGFCKFKLKLPFNNHGRASNWCDLWNKFSTWRTKMRIIIISNLETIQIDYRYHLYTKYWIAQQAYWEINVDGEKNYLTHLCANKS